VLSLNFHPDISISLQTGEILVFPIHFIIPA
jgi:hypothetical protein